MKRLICEKCGGQSSELARKEETIIVRGVDITFEANVRVCSCGNELFDEESEQANLTRAYDIYREQEGILGPSEIREIRESYGISQRALGRILGWGEITVHRYETGAVPNQSHSTMLELLRDPAVMKKLLTKGQKELPKATYEAVMGRVQEMLDQNEPKQSLRQLESKLGMGDEDLYSGFRQFDLIKFANALLFFAHNIPALYKTKFNKLMFYADFIHFDRLTNSITGSKYLKFEFGPVPEKYDGLLWELEQLGLIKVAVEPAGLYAGYVIYPLAEFDPTVFTEEELEILNEVAEKYGNMTAATISEMSHQESGWLETDPKQPIPYSYAVDLKA